MVAWVRSRSCRPKTLPSGVLEPTYLGELCMSDPDGRVTLFLTLMRQLEEVMQAEQVLLREMKLDRLRQLQAEKTSLAEHYELELRRLRTSPELFAAMETEDRAALEVRMREFKGAVRRNAERLAQAREVVDGVIRALGDSLASNGSQAGYGGASRSPADPGRVVAVAFDRRC